MPHQCINCGTEFADGSQEMLSGCPDCGGNKFQFKPARETGLRESSETDGPTTEDREYGEWPETAKRPAEHDETTDESPADPGGVASGSPNGAPAGRSSDESSVEEPTAAPTDESSVEEPTATPTDESSANPDPSERSSADQSSTQPPSERSSADESRSVTPSDRSSADSDPSTEPADSTDAYTENEAQASARTEMVSTDELPDHTQPEPATTPGSTEFERLREELNDQFESIRVVSPGTYELNLMELYDRQEYIISLREDGRYVIEMPGSWNSPDSE